MGKRSKKIKKNKHSSKNKKKTTTNKQTNKKRKEIFSERGEYLTFLLQELV